MDKKNYPNKAKYLSGKRILPQPITAKTDIVKLIDNLDAYNAGRLRAACHLLKEKYSRKDVTVGLSLAGALTPAGLGPSAIIPLMNHGFVDWITATGANMYHDLHFAFNLPMHRGSHLVDDADLRKEGVTRIYDILFDYEDVLMETDRRLRRILVRPEFQKEMGTREFYHHLGKVMSEFEEKNRLGQVSIVAGAGECPRDTRHRAHPRVLGDRLAVDRGRAGLPIRLPEEHRRPQERIAPRVAGWAAGIQGGLVWDWGRGGAPDRAVEGDALRAHVHVPRRAGVQGHTHLHERYQPPQSNVGLAGGPGEGQDDHAAGRHVQCLPSNYRELGGHGESRVAELDEVRLRADQREQQRRGNGGYHQERQLRRHVPHRRGFPF